jgi:hypothetical protein
MRPASRPVAAFARTRGTGCRQNRVGNLCLQGTARHRLADTIAPECLKLPVSITDPASPPTPFGTPHGTRPTHPPNARRLRAMDRCPILSNAAQIKSRKRQIARDLDAPAAPSGARDFVNLPSGPAEAPTASGVPPSANPDSNPPKSSVRHGAPDPAAVSRTSRRHGSGTSDL